MDNQSQVNRTRSKHEERRERPHRAAKSRPRSLRASGVTPASCWSNRTSCFGRGERFCRTDYMQLCMQSIDNSKQTKEEYRCHW